MPAELSPEDIDDIKELAKFIYSCTEADAIQEAEKVIQEILDQKPVSAIRMIERDVDDDNAV